MSKRTPGLPKPDHGFWPTPHAAIAPLVPYLPPRCKWGDPCAGDLALVNGLLDLLPTSGCMWASDIVSRVPGVDELDALTISTDTWSDLPEIWITNPPWPVSGKRGDPAMSIIRHLCQIAPMWALLPWDFAANDYFRHVSASCSEIIPIGRVSWMGNGMGGYENCAWYRFDAMNRFPTVVRARGAAS